VPWCLGAPIEVAAPEYSSPSGVKGPLPVIDALILKCGRATAVEDDTSTTILGLTTNEFSIATEVCLHGTSLAPDHQFLRCLADGVLRQGALIAPNLSQSKYTIHYLLD
jgi:hypothetical protein